MDLLNHNKHPVLRKKWTLSQRAADKLTAFVGSWIFIVLVLVFLVIWVTANVLMLVYRWDPYPFILLNLVLACLTAIQAPIILMSQNRQAQRDRIHAEYAYQVDKKAEKEIRDIKIQLNRIERKLK